MLDAAGELPPLPPTPPLDGGLKQALERDPSLQEARARVRGAEAVTQAIGAELRPDLVADRHVFRAGRNSDAIAADRYRLTTARCRTSPTGTSASSSAGRLTIRSSRHAATQLPHASTSRGPILESMAQQESAAVQQGYEEVQVAQAALVGLQRAVDAAHANYAQAEARFKAGLGTSLELADAEAVRTETEIQLAVGRYDVLRARALLARLFGEEER